MRPAGNVGKGSILGEPFPSQVCESALLADFHRGGIFHQAVSFLRTRFPDEPKFLSLLLCCLADRQGCTI